MSELKAVHAFDVYEAYTKTGDDDAAQVYIKYEADNVISTIRAERDEYRYNLSCARNEIHNLSMSMREDVKRIADKDKVIAEKDKEIQRLENLCESYRIDCDNQAIREANAYKDIERDNKQFRHQKYKRCLAMARWCRRNRLRASVCGPGEKIDFYFRCYKRWLELAETLKPNNQTARRVQRITK